MIWLGTIADVPNSWRSWVLVEICVVYIKRVVYILVKICLDKIFKMISLPI